MSSEPRWVNGPCDHGLDPGTCWHHPVYLDPQVSSGLDPVAAYRADLEAKVRALPLPDDLDDEIVVRNYRRTVLRLLTDGAEPPKGTAK